MITIKQHGDFKFTEKFMRGAVASNPMRILDSYGRQGVFALSQATPKDTGETANSWGYRISKTKKGYRINWTNSSNKDGVPIVILLQYGHGTRGGTFVEGIDFINPVMRPILQNIAENLWKEVTSL
jgi:hypothetical protein